MTHERLIAAKSLTEHSPQYYANRYKYDLWVKEQELNYLRAKAGCSECERFSYCERLTVNRQIVDALKAGFRCLDKRRPL